MMRLAGWMLLLLVLATPPRFVAAQCAPCPNGIIAGPTLTRGTPYPNVCECGWEARMRTWLHDIAEPLIPHADSGSALPGTCVAGLDLFLKTGDHSVWICTQTNTWSPIGAAGAIGSFQTTVIENVVAADDDYEFFQAPPAGATLVAVGCHCDLNCTTAAHLAFEDRSLNAIGLTGGGDLTCGSGTGNTTLTTFDTADGDRILVAGEGAKFSVTNTPTASQRITVTLTYDWTPTP